MKSQDIRRAVLEIDDDWTTETAADDLVRALKLVLPLIKTLLSDMPWWRRIVLGVTTLIAAIEAYLREENG